MGATFEEFYLPTLNPYQTFATFSIFLTFGHFNKSTLRTNCSRKVREIESDGRTDRQTHRQTHTQTDTQTDRACSNL